MFRNALLLFVLLQSILKVLFISYLISLKAAHGNYCHNNIFEVICIRPQIKTVIDI